MANVKWTAKTQNTAPLGSDLTLMVDDPAGTPLSQKIYLGDWNILPEGYMLNGKIVVTVTTNNLTVALKTKSGGNPSATDPVSVWINGSFRRCTAALSVTKNAGTNWCNAGAAELATKEIDFFVYLIWNTGPATDIVDIAFSRIPFGRVYSDFSATTTNEKYLAYGNATAPASTDDCIVIGRFAATNSGTASFNWSVPTFTNVNLIQYPCFETRRLTWVPVFTNLSVGNGTLTADYYITDKVIQYRVNLTWGSTTSISGSVTHTLPFSSAISNYVPGTLRLSDTGTADYYGPPVITTSNVTYLVFTASGTYVAQAALSSTIPHTWATTDVMYEQCEYPIV